MRLVSTDSIAIALACTFALAACSSDSGSGSGATGENGGVCADGFTADQGGDGCVEIRPDAACPVGTRAALGKTTCTPIAQFACPAGFVADPSGWGCRDVSPADECVAGTIEELGSTSCAPIGDCSAAFPPANATLFVDDDTAVPDGTHFKTIFDATKVATAGSVIAVEAGTYTEAIAVHAAYAIVGRCAAQVAVKSPNEAAAGFSALNVAGSVSVRGLSFSGFRGGIVEQNADVTVTDCDIRGSEQSGIVAIGGKLHVAHTRASDSVLNKNVAFGALITAGAVADFDRIAFAKNPLVGLEVQNATATVTNSVIRNGSLDAAKQAGAGVAVSQGSTVTIDASAIVDNHSSGVEAYDAKSQVTLKDSVIRGTLADGLKKFGDGIALSGTGSAHVETTTISSSADSGVVVNGAGTTFDMSSSVILGDDAALAHGLGVSGGGSAAIDGVVIANVHGYGVLAQDTGSALTVSGSLIRDVSALSENAGVSGVGAQIVFGGTLTMTDTTMTDTTEAGVLVGGIDEGGSGGTATLTKVLQMRALANAVGDFGRGVQATDGGVLTANACAFVDNQESAFVVGINASADVRDSVLRGSGSIGPTRYGYGAVVLAGAMLSLRASAVRDNLGVALAFDASAGTVDNVIVAHNQIGIFTKDATLNDVAAPPADGSDPQPLQVFVSKTRFVDNQTRVSSEDVPLPQIIP